MPPRKRRERGLSLNLPVGFRQEKRRRIGSSGALTRSSAAQVARAAGGQLMRYAADRVLPGISTAYDVGRTAYGLYKAARGGKKAKRVSTGFTATSLGKFSSKKKKASASKEALYSKTGYVIKRETNGEIAGESLVFLTHSSYVIDDLFKATWGAIIRKLFKKAGYEIDSIETLPGRTPTDADSNTDIWKIVLERKSREGAPDNNFILTTGTTATLKSVAADVFSGTVAWFGSQGATATNSNTEVTYIYLYDNTKSAGEDRPLSSINLMNEKVMCYGKSNMTIQNRTATTAGQDADTVNQLPMIGKRYFFNTGVPQNRVPDVGPMCKMNFENGIFVGNNAFLVSSLREPPVATAFRNIKGYNGVKIMPGEMKYGKVYHEWKGTLQEMYKKFRRDTSIDLDPGAPFYSAIYYHPGTSELYALEHSINLTADSDLKAAFEVQHEIGVMLKTSKKRSLLSEYNQVSNFVPL